MGKKAIEWFDLLPEPIRVKAVTNTKRSKPYTGDGMCNSLEQALAFAFYWKEVPEGASYWSSISERAERGEFNKEPL